MIRIITLSPVTHHRKLMEHNARELLMKVLKQYNTDPEELGLVYNIMKTISDDLEHSNTGE